MSRRLSRTTSSHLIYRSKCSSAFDTITSRATLKFLCVYARSAYRAQIIDDLSYLLASSLQHAHRWLNGKSRANMFTAEITRQLDDKRVIRRALPRAESSLSIAALLIVGPLRRAANKGRKKRGGHWRKRLIELFPPPAGLP